MILLKKFLATIALVPLLAVASEGGFPLDHAPERGNDLPALQNGARLFVNYCLNCHSASLVRYNRLRDIGLSDDQIAAMLQDSFHTAEFDKNARALAEARLEADRMWLATQSALQADGDLLTADERRTIDDLMAAALQSKTLDDAAAIEAATDALAKGTEAFAAQRMNRGIQQALAGQHIETL